MLILEFDRRRDDSIADIEALLEGNVFHVTKRDYWPSILACNEICPNADGHLPSTFGSANSFFRRRGCVSVFDYRVQATAETEDLRTRCWPFQRASEGQGISILVFASAIHTRLIPWTRWHDEEAHSEMVVPHVEAGHPGAIPLSEVELVAHVKLREVPGSIASRLAAARQRRSAA